MHSAPNGIVDLKIQCGANRRFELFVKRKNLAGGPFPVEDSDVPPVDDKFAPGSPLHNCAS